MSEDTIALGQALAPRRRGGDPDLFTPRHGSTVRLKDLCRLQQHKRYIADELPPVRRSATHGGV